MLLVRLLQGKSRANRVITDKKKGDDDKKKKKNKNNKKAAYDLDVSASSKDSKESLGGLANNNNGDDSRPTVLGGRVESKSSAEFGISKKESTQTVGESPTVLHSVSNSSLSTPTAATRDRLMSNLQQQMDKPIKRVISFNGESLKYLTRLLDNNRAWAAEQVEKDPEYFFRNKETQRPNYLWIGCSDSRVPANQIVNLPAGEMLVHRNIANMVQLDDPNCMAVIQYAVDVLKVQHIIVCGHYRCGGVRASTGPKLDDPLEGWITNLRELCSCHSERLEAMSDETAKWDFLCEEGVKFQVGQLERCPTVVNAWKRNQPLALHGWIYAIETGLLKDLKVTHDVCFFPTAPVPPSPRDTVVTTTTSGTATPVVMAGS